MVANNLQVLLCKRSQRSCFVAGITNVVLHSGHIRSYTLVLILSSYSESYFGWFEYNRVCRCWEWLVLVSWTIHIVRSDSSRPT